MFEIKDGEKAFYPKNRKEWRVWLEENHKIFHSVWLIIYHKGGKMPSINYEEAIEEALCFGWIDSKTNKRDQESYYLFFSQRSPKSNWSFSNRQRVERLIKQGLMTKSGFEMIEIAKKTGTWTILEDVQNLVIPDDLQKLFDERKTAFNNFLGFPPSSKKIILAWILNAKKPETREKRIKETVEFAEIYAKSHSLERETRKKLGAFGYEFRK